MNTLPSRRALLVAFVALGLLASCRGGKGRPAVAMPEAVLLDISGTWEARALEVQIRSRDNGSQDEELRFNTAEQSRLKGRKPQLTAIDPTGGYREETWSLQDSLLSAQNGAWHQHRDSVYFRPETEGARKLAYGVTRIGNQLQLHVRVDYDGDGQRDDVLSIVLEKQ
jgi:hypothetical protein